MKLSLYGMVFLLLLGSLAAADMQSLESATTLKAVALTKEPIYALEYESKATFEKTVISATETEFFLDTQKIATLELANQVEYKNGVPYLKDCDLFTCTLIRDITPSVGLQLSAKDLTGGAQFGNATVQKVFYMKNESYFVDEPIYEEKPQLDENDTIRFVTVQTGTKTTQLFRMVEETNLSTLKMDSGKTYRFYVRFTRPSMEAVDIYDTFAGIENKEAAWWNTSWTFKYPIYINTTVQSNLVNFPVKISINTSNSTIFNATTCTNIRFTNVNENITLYYDLNTNDSKFCGNETNNATYWVSVNTTNSSVGNTTIYLYGGNVAETSGENENALWRAANYTGVFHLEEAAAPWVDAAGYNNLTNSTPAFSRVDGQIGYAVRTGATSAVALYGTNNPYQVSISLGGISAYTIKSGAGINSAATWANAITIGNEDGSSGGQQLTLAVGTVGGSLDNMTCFEGNYFANLLGNVSTQPNYYTCQTYGSGYVITSYKNGTVNTNNNHGSPQTNLPARGISIGMGNRTRTPFFNGTIDEVRAWNGTRTEDWLKAEALVQPATIGPVESGFTPPTVTVTYTYNQTDIYTYLHTLSFNFSGSDFTDANFTSLTINSIPYGGVVKTTGGSFTNLSVSATPEQVISDTIMAVDWSYVLYNATSVSPSTETYNINVTPGGLFLCNATYTTPSINYTFFDEESGLSVNTTLTASYLIDLTGVDKTTTAAQANNTTTVCINPSNASFTVEATDFISATGYVSRVLSWLPQTYSNTTVQRRITMLNATATLAQSVLFSVVSAGSYTPYPGYTITVDKYSFTTSTYTPSASMTTDVNGQTSGVFLIQTPKYNVTVYDTNGVQVYNNPDTVFCQSGTVPCQEVIQLGSGTPTYYVGTADQFQTFCSFINTTYDLTCVINYTPINTIPNAIQLTLVNASPNNWTVLAVNFTNYPGTTLIVNVPNVTGTYKYDFQLWFTDNSTNLHLNYSQLLETGMIQVRPPPPNQYAKDGWLFALFLILAVSLALSFHPSTMILGAGFSTAAASLIGLITLEPTTFITLIVMTLAVAFWVKD